MAWLTYHKQGVHSRLWKFFYLIYDYVCSQVSYASDDLDPLQLFKFFHMVLLKFEVRIVDSKSTNNNLKFIWMVDSLNKNLPSPFQTQIKTFFNSQVNDYKLSTFWEVTQVFRS